MIIVKLEAIKWVAPVTLTLPLTHVLLSIFFCAGDAILMPKMITVIFFYFYLSTALHFNSGYRNNYVLLLNIKVYVFFPQIEKKA